MAATETNTEAKQVVEEHSEPLICKTTVLKVSIHCEGCKRKVKKILQGIHGVYDINIDLRQQKVVVTGNVTSDILIRKLTRAGKHAELWPEQPDSKKKKQGKPESKEKQSNPESSEETNQSGQNDNKINQSGQNDNETSKIKNVEGTGNTAKNSDGCGGVNVNNNKPNEGCATGKTGVVQVQEPKPEVRQTVVLPAGPVAEKKVSVAVQFPNENEASANEKTGGSSNGGKKKKKKGKVNNNNGNETANVTVEHCGEGPANDGSGNRSQGHVHGLGHHGSVPVSSPANESPPRRHHMHHQYPPHYYAPPPAAPVCTVSYHTAYPSSSSSSSYGAAYYAPPQPYSYAHVVHPGTEMEPNPRPYTYEPESYAPSQPSDSFVLFSDENPNACSVM